MGYFASRAAPLGAASAPLVTATFFNFHPGMVARAIPDAWAYADPDSVHRARTIGAAEALDRLLGTAAADEVAAAAELAEAAVDGCGLAGRPLFAAMAALARPTEPLTRVWHAATLLREHRGDGHVAACLAHGLDGIEALVTFAASGAVPRDVLQPNRGWSDDEWEGAEHRLAERGWLDLEGGLTEVGRAGRQAIEDATDELAAEPWAALGEARSARLHDLLAPMAAAVVAGAGIPAVNPMGVPTR